MNVAGISPVVQAIPLSTSSEIGVNEQRGYHDI